MGTLREFQAQIVPFHMHILLDSSGTETWISLVKKVGKRARGHWRKGERPSVTLGVSPQTAPIYLVRVYRSTERRKEVCEEWGAAKVFFPQSGFPVLSLRVRAKSSPVHKRWECRKLGPSPLSHRNRF